MAVWTGWLAALLVVLTGSVPLGIRLRRRRRAALESKPMRAHVIIGLVTGAFAFAHTLFVVPDLGAPGAVGGGMLALGAGVAAFFVLVAHTGLGFQLRRPKLKDRAEKRRAHSMTAALIVVTVTVHVVALFTGAH